MDPLNDCFPESNSQVGQDIFVLGVSKKRDGFFIEIGGFHSRKLSNTFLLEDAFAWGGVILEINAERAEELKKNRKSRVIVADATKFDWRTATKQLGIPRKPDYLQVDCEPALSSLLALFRVLSAGIRPHIITFEHEAYARATLLRFLHQGRLVRLISRALLTALRYQLVGPNIGTRDTGKPFEDWWVRKPIDLPRPTSSSQVTSSASFLANSGIASSYGALRGR